MKSRSDRLTRLARMIESLNVRDEAKLHRATSVDRIRPLGALSLHLLCSDFVNGVNAKLSQPAVTLDPPEWSPEKFNDAGANLIQINLRGRLLQIAFQSTEQFESTEDFNKPYVLEGAVRSFNQDLLDLNRIDEQQIYFCIEGEEGKWYFNDRRLYRTGPVDQKFFIDELEQLL